MLAVQNKRIVRGSSRYDTNELETRLPWISISRFVSSNRRLLRCSFPFFLSLSLLSVSQGSVRAEGGRRREVSLRTRTRFLLSRSSLESRRRKKRIISGASFDHVPTGIFLFFLLSLPSLFFFSNKDSSKGRVASHHRWICNSIVLLDYLDFFVGLKFL